MKPLGWVFLLVSWVSLTYYTAWCFYKVFTAPFDRDEEEIPPTP
jgi:hypothetical protein